jgi:hypothetical protein
LQGDLLFPATGYRELSERFLVKRSTDLTLLYAKINDAFGISLFFLYSISMLILMNSGIFSCLFFPLISALFKV